MTGVKFNTMNVVQLIILEWIR